MGRVPLLFLVSACMVISACAPETDPPDPQEQRQTNEAVRDAGQAARDAMKKAGDALRRLSGAEPAPPAPEPVTPVVTEPAPAAELAPPTSPAGPVGLSASIIPPVPDETERLEEEQHIQVERDASVATQEAKERILEATRRAADRFRRAGEGMVDAFRHDDLESDASSDTMSDAQAGTEPAPGAPTPETPRPE